MSDATASVAARGDGPARRLVLAVCTIVGVLAFLAAAAGVDVRATYGAQTSGDEPFYLLTTISLAEDGDLDVSDERADERWRPFHEVRLAVQEQVVEGGRMVSPHDPLLPAVMTVPWRLGGWRGVKLALAALAGLLASATAWTAIRRFDVDPVVAGATVGGLSLAWPLAGYGTQVYPEVPAALVTVIAVAVATRRQQPRLRDALLLAALVSALPWLGIKYAPVAAALAALATWRWWRHGRAAAAATLVGLLAVSGVAYLAAHQAWYGGWTVYAAADHFVDRGEFSVVGFHPDPLGRARRLIGLLVGRDFGLAAWQPLWLLAPAALAWIAVRRPRDWTWLVVPLAAGWLNATFVALTMQGWWVPGRQVVVVLPLAAIALAAWLDVAGRRWQLTAAALGTAGITTYAWLVVDGLAGRLTWIVDFAAVGDPLYAVRRALMPNYLQVSPATWVSQSAWLVIVAATCVVAARHARRHRSDRQPVTVNEMVMPSA